MYDGILRIKGWQIYAVMQLAVIGLMLFWLSALHVQVEESIGTIAAFGLPLAVLEAGYFGWMLAVSAAMNERMPPELRRGILFPALGLFFAIVYIFFVKLSFREGLKPWWLLANFLSSFINFYLLWLLSRSVAAAEEKSKPSLNRVMGIFFAVWFTMFLPIGAWWVQNRARRVAGVS